LGAKLEPILTLYRLSNPTQPKTLVDHRAHNIQIANTTNSKQKMKLFYKNLLIFLFLAPGTCDAALKGTHHKEALVSPIRSQTSSPRSLEPAENIDCNGFIDAFNAYVEEQLLEMGAETWTEYVCNQVMNEMVLRPVIENPEAHFSEANFGAYSSCAQDFFEDALANTVIEFLPNGGFGAAENDCTNVVGHSLEHHVAKVNGLLDDEGGRRLEIFIAIIVSVATGAGVGTGLATRQGVFDSCRFDRLAGESPSGSLPRSQISDGQVQSWLSSTQPRGNVLTCNIRSTRDGLNLLRQPSGDQFVFPYLSTASNGAVDTYCRDDDSGRQLWHIIDRRIFGETNQGYNILVSGGTDAGETFLSTTAGGNVDLYSEDDDSGRQRWRFERLNRGRNSYSIRVAGGTNPGETYLSTDGNRLVDLFDRNEANGRQDWMLEDCSFSELSSVVDVCSLGIYNDQQPPSGASFLSDGDVLLWMAYEQTETALSCEIRNECGSAFPFLSVSAAGDADAYCTNDGTGRQRWEIRDIGHGYQILVSDGVTDSEATRLTSSPTGRISTERESADRAQTWFFYSDGDSSNQFQILVESGSTNEGERFLSTDCDRLVDLYFEVESNRRQLWSLENCFEVPL